MSKGQFVNPRNLLKVGLKLAKEACKIVKQSYMNKNVKHFLKATDDPVTEADYKIQTMLIRGFKMQFPRLKIVGEEEKQYEGKVQTQYQKLQFPLLPQSLFFPKEYELSKSCLWIDPIDNTRGFIDGDIQTVTNLIGLSYQNKAQLGIVGLPFKKSKQRIYYNPSILFGSVSGGFAFQYFPLQQKWLSLINDRPLKEKARVLLSPYRENAVEKKIVERIKGEIVLAGGAGYKMIAVAKKEAELMAYSLSFTQKWDTCAGEAVIKAMKGYCTTQFGDEILYNPEKPKQFNENGVICSLNSQLIKASVEVCKQQNLKKI